MINTSHSQPQPDDKLLKYLQDKLSVSEDALKLGIRQSNTEQAPLPVVLWSFGLITLEQYQNVLDWQQNQNI